MNGANVNELNNDGKSALHYAAWGGHLTTVQLLVEKNANIEVIVIDFDHKDLGFFLIFSKKNWANFLQQVWEL